MKKILRFLTIIIFILGGLYIFSYFRYSDKTFILCYHKIDYYHGGLKSICVSPETFDRQMKFLVERGYRTVSLTELITLLNKKKGIPRKIFVITFDDGYENNYKYAFPILKKYNFTATIFVTAGYIGKSYKYPGQPTEKHLTRKQIKEMNNYFEFGSHSLSHPKLTKISQKKLVFELQESKKIIEKIVGKQVNHFCYPFGNYDESVKETLKPTGYRSACTTQIGLVDKNTNPFAFPRFEFKEWSAMSLKDFVKSIDFYLKIFFGL